MTARSRLIRACHAQPTDRPPVWLMRQAGRYLPEYRALKERHGFLTMVKTPDLAATVTLQPLERYALDAAIIFSDILVIPEALGQPYHFRDAGGIGMDYLLDSAETIHALNVDGAAERLAYVYDALRETRTRLGDETALLGFCGSPWTLACYMVEGGSSRDYTRLKALALQNPALFGELMEKLTATCAEYLRRQIAAGADAVQIFDSWGALCPSGLYEEWSLRWIREIIRQIDGEAPVILYAKGMSHHAPTLAQTGARVVSVDWTVDARATADSLPADVAIQGNLDPAFLTTTPEITRAATERLLASMRGRPGYIFNLGHGMIPSADPACVAALVDAVVASADA